MKAACFLGRYAASYQRVQRAKTTRDGWKSVSAMKHVGIGAVKHVFI
ncbi:hypothetical protein [Negativicoccus succinicivorans]|nr:hypothetical protein [Negativicoccus succinicivorans]